MRAKPHFYTKEQIDFLENNVKGLCRKELTNMFNNHFNLNLNLNQIAGTLKRQGLTNGRDCKFQKGNQSWNKGMKGINFGGENGKKTQFKKGQKPINYKPVGSERVSVDGYIEVKVADPSKWKSKHVVIWEESYGPIPKGHCLLFLDGNKQNVELSNLKLITRQQLVRLNQKHLLTNNAELNQTAIIVADIYNKMGERKRKAK